MLNYGEASPAVAGNESDSPSLNAVSDAEILLPVKGRNIPKEVKPQAYCHPAVAKAHKGVSPQKEKRKNKNKNKIRKK